jgi:hypothetical protein
MTWAGVLVSVNSDGEDLARHFNHDVARLKKYGDLTEDEALPSSRSTRPGSSRSRNRVGSLDVGKDADARRLRQVPAQRLLGAGDGLHRRQGLLQPGAEKERERRVEAARRALAGGAKEVSNAR